MDSEQIEQYHEDHEVVYTLMIEVDGVVIAKRTDSSSATNLDGLGYDIDEIVNAHIAGELADKAELAVESQTEALIEESRGI